MNMNLNFEMVPEGWALCFNHDCPRCTKCLRHEAGLLKPAEMDCGKSVYPDALKNDGSCRWFRSNERQRMATGFSGLFDKVSRVDAPKMRNDLVAYLGGNGTYYLYRNGKRLLTPKQQQWIDKLFRSYGYDGAPAFQHYETSVEFF